MSSSQLVEGEVENDGDGWATQLPRLHQPLHTQVIATNITQISPESR